jgi:thiosulfate dehydrogenase
MRGFLLGLVVAIAAVLAAGYVIVIRGWIPAGQDVKPSKVERWMAKTSLRATMGRESHELSNPLPLNDESLASGIALYVAHCQVCHGGPDGSPSLVARGLSPEAPQLARHGVEDDPEGSIYWKITHGIRFTGMPAFGKTLSDTERWQMTSFLKHMNKLPAGAQASWHTSLPPH